MAKSVKVKYSNQMSAKMKRIKNLPVLYDAMMRGKLKKDANGLIKEYQRGIEKNSLGLKTLAPFTIKDKGRMGLPKPAVPLYGLGKDNPDSLYNCLRITKLKNGYKVAPSKRMHHLETNESKNPVKISLKKLFLIHEYGCIIDMTKKQKFFLRKVKGMNIPPKKKQLVIQPRPAFQKAYEVFMLKKKRDKKETSKQVKAAITEYINNAKTTWADGFKKYSNMFKDKEE